MKRGSFKVLPLMLFLLITVTLLFGSMLSYEGSAQDSQENITEIEPNITIQLSKAQYLANEKIEGKLILKLTNTTLPDSLVTIKIPGKTVQQRISNILSNASINFTILNGSYAGVSPSKAKDLQIQNGETKRLGVMLPAFSEVNSFNMLVSGPANNQLKNPQMDIGADGFVEWYYLGNLVSWNTQASLPNGLNELAGEKIFLSSKDTIYCQRINLSFGKDFNVNVNYKSLGQQTDLKAVIYSIAGGDAAFPQGGNDFCDLPESTTSGYHSCTAPIHLNSAEKGDHLVCVYYDGDVNANAYEINADTSTQSQTSFVCQKGDPVFCEPAPYANYFIKVFGASYSEKINSPINFNEWSLGVNASLNALRQEIGSEPYIGKCASGELCLAPIEITGIGSGSLSLSSLEIEYQSGTNVKVAGKKDLFYDVVKNPDRLGNVKGVPLVNPIIVEIPLSLFNLSANAIPVEGAESASAVMFAGYGTNYEANASLEVFFNAIPASGSQKLIIETRDAISALPQDENANTLLELSGIGATIKEVQAALAGFESRLLGGDTEQLQNEIVQARLKMPREIKSLGSMSDIQLIEPDDITSDIVPSDKKDDAYFFQDNAAITIKITKFSVTSFDGDAKDFALIKKTIRAKKDIEKVDVYEAISKNSISSLDAVKFQETPQIVNEDPMVKWFLQSLKQGQSKTFTYIVEGQISGIDDFKSIIVATGPELCGNRKCDEGEDEGSCPGDCKPLSRCGDGVCTQDLEDAKTCPKDCKGKFPLIYVLAGGIILIGVLALYLIKGRKRSPFKTEDDLRSVVDYVKAAKQKKIKNEDIAQVLGQRGWTKEQAEFAIEKYLETVNTKPIQDYLVASLNKKIPLETIRQKLISQGWDESLVDKEIKKLTK